MITINGNIIQKDIYQILDEVKSQTGKLKDIRRSGDNIQITCPVHADGQENRPSCFISINPNRELAYGTAHCFTCGFKGSFGKFVGACFNKNESFGNNWLLTRYADVTVENHLNLERPIDLSERIMAKPKIKDESILNKFESYHPYMTQRGISDEVIKLFNLKYDPATKTIVFPVYNEKGQLSFLTKRSIEGKQFYIESGADKNIIYGLDKAQDYNEVYVCESQINALTLYSWGYPAVAMLGAGTTYKQVEKLRNSKIRSFILCYDPDEAGIHGAQRFKKFIGPTKFVTTLTLPQGKDVNDLTKEEFEQILSLQKTGFVI